MSEYHDWNYSECACDADWTDPRIHKLEAIVAELEAENAKLKQERDALLAFTIKRFPIVKALGGLLEVNKIIASEMDSILGKFRLEQQAKGVELALDQVGVSTSPIGTLVQLAEQLRNQAKEQGE